MDFIIQGVIRSKNAWIEQNEIFYFQLSVDENLPWNHFRKGLNEFLASPSFWWDDDLLLIQYKNKSWEKYINKFRLQLRIVMIPEYRGTDFFFKTIIFFHQLKGEKSTKIPYISKHTFYSFVLGSEEALTVER